jgi:hypothetical protein
MAKETFLDKFEALPKALKVLIFLFPISGWALSSIYRFCYFAKKGGIITLVIGLIGLVSGIGIIFGWADALSELKFNRVTFFVEE